MTKLISIVLLIHLPIMLVGQVNLVPNGDFENYSSCSPDSFFNVWLAPPWTNTGYANDSPDYYNTCCQPLFFPPDQYISYFGVPENTTGFQNAHSGNGYAGFFAFSINAPNGREFIQVQLIQPIVAGVKYEVSFHVSLADKFKYAVSTLGAHFSDTLIVRDSYMILNLNLIPQVQSPPDVLLDDKENWTVVRDTFSSRYGGERFLVIGNFNLDGESGVELLETGNQSHIHAYYYIDDVSVITLDSLTGVGELSAHAEFKAFPNPNGGRMTVRYTLKENETGTVELHDALGRLVHSESLVSGMDSMDIWTENANSGLYILSIRVNGALRHTERMSIMR